MSCSYEVKNAGLKSLKRMSELTEVPRSTLKSWFTRKPLMFEALLEYAVRREKTESASPRYVFIKAGILTRFEVISEGEKRFFVKPSDGRPSRYINKSEKGLFEGSQTLCDLWALQEARFNFFDLLQLEPEEVKEKERNLIELGFIMREGGGTFLRGTSTPHVISRIPGLNCPLRKRRKPTSV